MTHARLPFALSACVALLLSAAARADEWRLPLSIETAQGAAFDARSARLLPAAVVPAAEGLVVVDAARPTRWAGDPGRPPFDADGRLNTNYARYDLLLPAAGDYTFWYEYPLPKGTTRFVEMVNGQRVAAPINEENKEAAQPPRWVKGWRGRLGAGLNHFAVAWTPGLYNVAPRMQRIVLAADEAFEPGADLPAPATAAVQRAVATTAPMLVPGLRRLVALEGVPAGVLVEAAGEGDDWAPFQPGPWSGAVRFRFTLTPDAPAVDGVAVQVETADGALVRLANSASELIFERPTGALFLVLREGRTLAGGGAPVTLSSVDFKAMGEAVWHRVDPHSVSRMVPKPQYSRGQWDLTADGTEARPSPPERVSVDGDTLTIVRRYAVPGVGSARVTETIAPERPGVWRLAASVDSIEGPADLVALTFPTLDRVRIGASGLDDTILRTQSFGDSAQMPGLASIRDETYIGSVVMNWTQVYDAEGSLYLGVHDPAGTTTLHASQTLSQEGEQISLLTRRLDDLHPGESAQWETRLLLGGGGWHQGARLYGDWFTATHGPADYAGWMAETPGWIDFQAENYPGFTFEKLDWLLSVGRSIGFDWVQVWGQFGFDWGPCCAGWYAPAPDYGGPEALAAAAAEVARRGGRTGGYFHYEWLDQLPAYLDSFLGHYPMAAFPAELDRDTAEEIHRLRTVLDPANQVPPLLPPEDELARYRAQIAEHHAAWTDDDPQTRAKTVMWPTEAWIPAPEWRERMTHWVVDRYVRDWNCNTAYIDVMGTGGTSLDYDPRRGNNGDGSWGMGRKLLAQALSEEGRAANPEFGLAQEGLGDLPGLYAAKLCSGVYWGGRNVVRYTFPDRVLVHGEANAGPALNPLDRWLMTFREALRFDIVGFPTALPVRALNLMRAFTPELWHAMFQDSLGVSASDPRIEVRRLDGNNTGLPGAVLTITNPDRVDGAQIHVDASATGPFTAAFMVEESGEARALPLTTEGNVSSFAASPQMMSMVLLAGEVGAAPWPVARIQRVGPPALEVTLFNPAGDPREGQCEIEIVGLTEPYDDRAADARRMLPLAVTQLPYAVGAGDATTLSFPLRDLREHRYTVVADIVLSGDGGEMRRRVLLTPLVLDGSFEYANAGEGAGADGERALELPPSTEYQYHHAQLWLLPERQYRIGLQAKRSGFDAGGQGSLLRMYGADGEYTDVRFGLDQQRPNEWQQLGGEFTTPVGLTRAGLYLYNVRSPDTAWFDDIVVEDLGPADGG